MIGLSVALQGQVITEFPPLTPNSFPASIAAGSDGALWFTEASANQIGRITTDGVVTEFFVPTPLCSPAGIAAGPDGNIWFTELDGKKIGRITLNGVFTEFALASGGHPNAIVSGPDGNLWFTDFSGNKVSRITPSGVITEFPVPIASAYPLDIAAGPDGNLWFSLNAASAVGRITPAGVITMFPLPVPGALPRGITAGPDGNLWILEAGASDAVERMTTLGVVTGTFPFPGLVGYPLSIAAGPDGNLWFTENDTNRVGRITTGGLFTEFPIPAPLSGPLGIAAGPDGNLWFAESQSGLIGRLTPPFATPLNLQTDFHVAPLSISNINGILEPGESVQIAPVWKNSLGSPLALAGIASGLTGPAGATYLIDVATADYGTVAAGATVDCHDSTGDCYRMTVTGPRPVAHWDATFTETLNFSAVFNTWTIHIGSSFSDVLAEDQFYFFVESLFHSGITGGCGAGVFCPGASVTRAQMAVFLVKAKFGPGYQPIPASGTVFNDVHAGDFAASWIEEIATLGITGGCGGGNYCPDAFLTRAQMAVFILKTKHGSTYLPPACTQVFDDVVCPSTFAAWIEQLFIEGITQGCGGTNYCPDAPSTRGQMAVFLDKMMGLPGPPSPTSTPSLPTPTPIPPTPTPTLTSNPTNTPTPTPVPPTLTPTITWTPVTFTPTPPPTMTPITFTQTPTLTGTGGHCAVNCPTLTPTHSPTPSLR